MTNLGQSPMTPSIAVTDLDRARDFYVKKLGLKSTPGMPEGVAEFTGGNGSRFVAYEREAPPKADHTLLNFDVDDIEKTVSDLKKAGVRFEEYNMPGIKTVNGIATQGPRKMAWMKDPDGNILGLMQSE